MFDIFSRLAVINEPSLIEVAAAYALRHDFEGLSNYVHYLDVEGHKSQYVRENTEIECKVCENEDDATNITRVVTSATQLVILGITPQDEGFEPTYDGKVSDQGLHILDKLLRLFGANVASKTFRDGAGENHLDKMLYLAASTINDPRVIEALLDAGASVKPRLPMDVLSRERIQTALHQAITFSQFHAATALLAGATDETISTLVSSWIDVDPKRVQDTDTSAAWLFRESPFTKGVLKLLRATEEGCASAQVSEFLDQLETRIPAGTATSSARAQTQPCWIGSKSPAPYFTCWPAKAFTQFATDYRFCSPWGPTQRCATPAACCQPTSRPSAGRPRSGTRSHARSPPTAPLPT